jgi:hypothetical protein
MCSSRGDQPSGELRLFLPQVDREVASFFEKGSAQPESLVLMLLLRAVSRSFGEFPLQLCPEVSSELVMQPGLGLFPVLFSHLRDVHSFIEEQMKCPCPA